MVLFEELCRSWRLIVCFLMVPLALNGCIRTRPAPLPMVENQAFAPLYAADPFEKHPLPATDISGIDPVYLRTVVSYPTREKPGTIVIDTDDRHLYLVQDQETAIRYGIGVGAEGRTWAGRAKIGRKAEWPRWTPTAAMVERDPEKNGPWATGMPAGIDNPLGARALYLYINGRDSLYRIHGTNEPDSIGESVSSGCIRMLNQDVIDLYKRVPTGTTVVVLRQQIETPDSLPLEFDATLD